MKGKSLKKAGLAALVTAMFAASPSLADDATPIGKGADDLPLFDAHMHYSAPAWDPYPEKTVIELMDKSGVAMALVSSTPDEGTIRLLEFAPKRIVPPRSPPDSRVCKPSSVIHSVMIPTTGSSRVDPVSGSTRKCSAIRFSRSAGF